MNFYVAVEMYDQTRRSMSHYLSSEDYDHKFSSFSHRRCFRRKIKSDRFMQNGTEVDDREKNSRRSIMSDRTRSREMCRMIQHM